MIQALGKVCNVIANADGKHIYLGGLHGDAVLFITYLDAGTQEITLKESVSGDSEQNLAVIETAYKAPGTGGTWTDDSQTATATYTHDDATNDQFVFTVHSAQLSDGFNCVEVTMNTGTVCAITYDLGNKRIPTNLASPVVA